MFFTYILYSERIKCHYIGSTSDLRRRVDAHNAGLSRWTKAGIPWVIVHFETFLSRGEAVKREIKIKSYKNGVAFKKLIGK